MNEFWELFKNFRWLDGVDILCVAFLVYRVILLIKGTRAVQMLVGLFIIGFVYIGSRLLGLFTLQWILDGFLSSLVLVVVILFQSDIRRALINVGKKPFFSDSSSREEGEIIDELVRACVTLASRKIGALIVIERETGLRDILEIGVEIDAKVVAELIISIFLPYSPIHDGALILQQGRLKRAGCFLPLSQNPDINKSLGTRHRAAIGLTELVDAVVVVVSEETGKISVVVGGKITRDMSSSTLPRILKRLLEPSKK
ncbi:MAG: diadenylate cyclase CdaA [Deltaproteobacteria bacterium]|nr:diadenylate cyclase CdaA [Deltaproteobacteria bacterium]